jgi:hypothetical protein
LPSNAANWDHDTLISILESKIKDIEELEQKLATSKQNLKMMIFAINNKPDEITCAENASDYSIYIMKMIKMNKLYRVYI